MIILGIDPGSKRIGYGVINSGKKPEFIDCGIIEPRRQSQEEPEKLILEVTREFSNLIEKYRPKIIGMEKIYFSKNVKTGIAVAQTRGALLGEIGKQGLILKEFSPSEIKLNLTGYGLADKKAVAKMAALLLNLNPESLPKYDDASDALAIALAAQEPNY